MNDELAETAGPVDDTDEVYEIMRVAFGYSTIIPTFAVPDPEPDPAAPELTPEPLTVTPLDPAAGPEGPPDAPEEPVTGPPGTGKALDIIPAAQLDEYAAAIAKTLPKTETWEDLIGNERQIAFIRDSVASAKARGNPVDHILLFGPAGTGKTTISKIIARDMGGFYLETTAGTLTGYEEAMRALHKLNVGRGQTQVPSVWFIDEIHTLGKKGLSQEAFYPVLLEWKLYHNRQGKAVSFEKESEWKKDQFDIWPFTAIGATTDPGLLSAPLTRRFPLQIELEPYTDANISEIVRQGAGRMGIPMVETAADTLASYAQRNPGRAFNILAYARIRTDANKAPEISDDIIAETIERMGIYPLGLANTQVRTLQMLSGRYPQGIGQAELSRALNIQVSQFSSMIEPFLRQMEFIETRNRRHITPAGIRYLNELGMVDINRPQIRAVLANGDAR